MNIKKEGRNNKKFKVGRMIIIIIIAIYSLGQIFPLIWLIDFSLAKSGDLFGSKILIWPEKLQFHNYYLAWVDGNVPHYLFNSIIVNVLSVGFTIVLAVMMAYAFTRMKWKFSKLFLNIILLGLMIPIHATLLPNFISFGKVGILDSYLGLVLPYIAFSLPLATFIMTGFMCSIPRAIEEAAVIDGCDIYKIIFRIIFPLTKPAVVTVTVMTFISTWNEFIMASTYLSSERFKTLPFAVYNFAGQYASNYSVQFAVMTLVAIPSLIVYIILNEQITKGIALGSIKG